MFWQPVMMVMLEFGILGLVSQVTGAPPSSTITQWKYIALNLIVY